MGDSPVVGPVFVVGTVSSGRDLGFKGPSCFVGPTTHKVINGPHEEVIVWTSTCTKDRMRMGHDWSIHT